jgi:hypothetical protein
MFRFWSATMWLDKGPPFVAIRIRRGSCLRGHCTCRLRTPHLSFNNDQLRTRFAVLQTLSIQPSLISLSTFQN